MFFVIQNIVDSVDVLNSRAAETPPSEAAPLEPVARPKRSWLKIALAVIVVVVVVGAGFAYWWFSRSPSVPWLFKGAYGSYGGSTTVYSMTIDVTLRFELVDFNTTHGKLLTYMKMTYPADLHLDPYEFQSTTWSEIYGTSYETPGATFLSKHEDHVYFEGYGTRSCTIVKYAYQETDSSFDMTMYVDKETGWPLRIQYEYTQPIACSMDLKLVETNIPGL